MTQARRSVSQRQRPAAALRAARINLRASAGQDKLIRSAASVTGKTVSEFILDSACQAARGALADRTLFRLRGTHWKTFVAALDRPARDKPQLRDLLAERSMLEK